MGMYFRVQVWKRVWKMEYFGLKLGQDLGNRAAHPYQKFRGVPPPRQVGTVLKLIYSFHSNESLFMWLLDFCRSIFSFYSLDIVNHKFIVFVDESSHHWNKVTVPWGHQMPWHGRVMHVMQLIYCTVGTFFKQNTTNEGTYGLTLCTVYNMAHAM